MFKKEAKINVATQKIFLETLNLKVGDTIEILYANRRYKIIEKYGFYILSNENEKPREMGIEQLLYWYWKKIDE